MLPYAGTLFSTLAVYCRMLTYAGTLFSALFSRLLAVTQPVTSGEISHAEAAEESVGTSSVSAWPAPWIAHEGHMLLGGSEDEV